MKEKRHGKLNTEREREERGREGKRGGEKGRGEREREKEARRLRDPEAHLGTLSIRLQGCEASQQ